MQDLLNTLAAPVIDAAQAEYEVARDRYRAALNFAASCAPIHRRRAMGAVEACAARHRLALHAQQIVSGGPINLSDPRD